MPGITTNCSKQTLTLFFQCTRQYMSAIFYHDEVQKEMAEESMNKQKEKQKGKAITTLILPAAKFFEAEE